MTNGSMDLGPLLHEWHQSRTRTVLGKNITFKHSQSAYSKRIILYVSAFGVSAFYLILEPVNQYQWPVSTCFRPSSCGSTASTSVQLHHSATPSDKVVFVGLPHTDGCFEPSPASMFLFTKRRSFILQMCSISFVYRNQILSGLPTFSGQLHLCSYLAFAIGA